MGRIDRFRDSYDHYRRHVALGRVYSAWRALRYEVTGRDCGACQGNMVRRAIEHAERVYGGGL